MFDNPALLPVNPEYYAYLLSLPLLERERLLSGNWKIRPSAELAQLSRRVAPPAIYRNQTIPPRQADRPTAQPTI